MISAISNASLHKSAVSAFRVASARSMAGRILDCGGGLGEYLPHFKQCRPVVFDISLPALRALEYGEKVCGDGAALPFADSSFDGVWACAVAQYLHLEAFVRELRRVTRPGGRVLLLVPNGRSPWDRLKKMVGMDGWWDQENIVTQYSVDELAVYGKVVGEIRFLPFEGLFRRFPRFCHTLLLEMSIQKENHE